MRTCNMSIATHVGVSRNERPRHIGCMEAAAYVRTVRQSSGAVSDNRWTARNRTIGASNANAKTAGVGDQDMLHYAVVFFLIAIVAAILGFGGIAAGAAGIAKVLFFVFLVLAVITFLRRA